MKLPIPAPIHEAMFTMAFILLILSGVSTACSGQEINDLDKAYQQSVVDKDPTQLSINGYKLAEKYIHKGQVEKAIDQYLGMAKEANSLGVDSLYLSSTYAASYSYYLLRDYATADSLIDVVQNHEAATKIDLYLSYQTKSDISRGLLNYEYSLEMAEKALELAPETGRDIYIYDSYITKGSLLSLLNRRDEAIKVLLEATKHFPQDKKYDGSLASMYTKLAELYHLQGNLYKAKEYSEKLRTLPSRAKGLKNYYYSLPRYAQILFEMGEYEKSMERLNETMEAYNSFGNDKNKPSVFLVYFNHALRDNDLELAKSYLDSIEHYGKYLNGILSMQRQTCYWKYYYESKDFEKLEEFLTMDESIQKHLSIPKYKLQYHDYLYKLHKHQGNIDDALLHFEEVAFLSDSVFQNGQMAVVHDLEAKYNKSNQDKVINELNTKQELAALKIDKQRTINVIGLIAMIILLSIAFLLYRLYIRVNNQRKQILIADKEKDTLLREIHHRVKNNLQVISSLLSLQSNYIADNNALDALRQGQGRVQSMALIHQDLYQTDNLKGVGAQDYFEQLVENVLDSYELDDEDIDVELQIEEMMLDVDTMIPLGLVVNELINSCISEDPEADQTISINLQENGGQLELKVSDSLNNLVDLRDPSKKTFGFELIKAFTEKLQASISMEELQRGEFVLKIKKYKIAA